MLAENRLQLGRRPSKCGRALSDNRGHRLSGIPRTLGQDADAMQLGIGRLLRQLPDSAAEPAPRAGGQWRQHQRRGLIRVEGGGGCMCGGHQRFEEVDVTLRVEIRVKRLP